MDTFSQRLADAMDESQHNQSTLARALGTSQSSVGRWLGGAVPRDRALSELASKLGVSMRWLSDGTGERYLDGAPATRFDDPAVNDSDDGENRELFRALEQDTILGLVAGHISLMREKEILNLKALTDVRAAVEELLRRARASKGIDSRRYQTARK